MSGKVMSAAFVLLATVCAASVTLPAAAFAATSSDDHRTGGPADVQHITAAAIHDMLTEAVEVKGGVQRVDGNVLRVELPAEQRVLFFTQPGHLAHPGVVAAQIVERDGTPGIATSGWWAGDARGRHAKVADAARAAGLEVLDLLPIYARHPVEDLRTDPWDTFHLDADGHRIAAEALVEVLGSAPGRLAAVGPLARQVF